MLFDSDCEKIRQLYARKPGLTCAAIAKALSYSEEDVRRVLGYPSLPKFFNRQMAPLSEIEKNRPNTCSRCGSSKVLRHGLERGVRVYRCKKCGKCFGSGE